jgi:hypothetical protein
MFHYQPQALIKGVADEIRRELMRTPERAWNWARLNENARESARTGEWPCEGPKDDEIVRQNESAGFLLPRAVRFQFFAGILPVCFSRDQCTRQFQNLAGKFPRERLESPAKTGSGT